MVAVAARVASAESTPEAGLRLMERPYWKAGAGACTIDESAIDAAI